MVAFKNFAGLRNDVSAERFGPADLALATNVDLDNTGKLLSRGGYLNKISAAIHSLWAAEDICLFVTGTNLKRLGTDLTSSTVIRSDLTAGLRMSYFLLNGQVYYSNGEQTGIYGPSGNRTWGIVPPVFQPLAEAAYGDMTDGIYQFALTYVRRDGQESGTGIADSINLTTGAINFTDIPVSDDPDVTHKILYLTPPDGDVLYRALILDNATTSASYNGGQLLTPLQTQFLQQAPAGQLVGYAFGHAWVANGLFLHYSDPHGLELFDLRKYFGFEGNITLFAPVQDGIWIGTDRYTYFLSGRDPESMTLYRKANDGVLPGTLQYAPASQVKGANQGPDESVPLWTSHSGICTGLSGGTLLNLTQARYAISAASEGAALYHTQNGIDQYLTVLRS